MRLWWVVVWVALTEGRAHRHHRGLRRARADGDQDDCLQPVERGKCMQDLIRYYYDPFSDECKRFSYSGCSGNGNNFLRRAQCRLQCVRDTKRNPFGPGSRKSKPVLSALPSITPLPSTTVDPTINDVIMPATTPLAAILKESVAHSERGGSVVIRGGERQEQTATEDRNPNHVETTMRVPNVFDRLSSPGSKSASWCGHCDPLYGVCNNGVCGCKPGFQQMGRICIDVDECETSSICPALSRCVNTVGSYRCECRAGSMKDGKCEEPGGDACEDGFDGEAMQKDCNSGELEIRYYFDADSSSCKSFFYGGCETKSRNIFTDVETCDATCTRRVRDYLKKMGLSEEVKEEKEEKEEVKSVLNLPPLPDSFIAKNTKAPAITFLPSSAKSTGKGESACKKPFDEILRVECEKAEWTEKFYWNQEVKECEPFWWDASCGAASISGQNVFATFEICAQSCGESMEEGEKADGSATHSTPQDRTHDTVSGHHQGWDSVHSPSADRVEVHSEVLPVASTARALGSHSHDRAPEHVHDASIDAAELSAGQPAHSNSGASLVSPVSTGTSKEQSTESQPSRHSPSSVHGVEKEKKSTNAHTSTFEQKPATDKWGLPLSFTKSPRNKKIENRPTDKWGLPLSFTAKPGVDESVEESTESTVSNTENSISLHPNDITSTHAAPEKEKSDEGSEETRALPKSFTKQPQAPETDRWGLPLSFTRQAAKNADSGSGATDKWGLPLSFTRKPQTEKDEVLIPLNPTTTTVAEIKTAIPHNLPASFTKAAGKEEDAAPTDKWGLPLSFTRKPSKNTSAKPGEEWIPDEKKEDKKEKTTDTDSKALPDSFIEKKTDNFKWNLPDSVVEKADRNWTLPGTFKGETDESINAQTEKEQEQEGKTTTAPVTTDFFTIDVEKEKARVESTIEELRQREKSDDPCDDAFDSKLEEDCANEDWRARWYFDTEKSACKQFWYGGCDSLSRNVFPSAKACKDVCGHKFPIRDDFLREHSRPSVTTPTETPPTESTTPPTPPGFFEERITQFFEVGPTNAALKAQTTPSQDDFSARLVDEAPSPATERAIDTLTLPTQLPNENGEDPCDHPFDKNMEDDDCSGDNWQVRAYFDHVSRDCKQFWYGGCASESRNLFADKATCRGVCAHRMQSTEPQTQALVGHPGEYAPVYNDHPQPPPQPLHKDLHDIPVEQEDDHANQNLHGSEDMSNEAPHIIVHPVSSEESASIHTDHSAQPIAPYTADAVSVHDFTRSSRPFVMTVKARMTTKSWEEKSTERPNEEGWIWRRRDRRT